MKQAIFVASLPSETERRAFVGEQFAKYSLMPEYVDAVDMRQAEASEIKDYQVTMQARQSTLLRASEIGCALSHLHIAQEVVNRQLDFALVTEDDVEFLSDPNEMLLAMPEILAKSTFDIALLGYVKVYPEQLAGYYHRLPIKIDARFKNHTMGRPYKQKQCGAVAYIITQRGAQKLLAANTPLCYVADAWDDFVYRHGLEVKHVRPSIAIESQAFQSTNGNERHQPSQKPWYSRQFYFFKSQIHCFAMNYLNMPPK